MALMSAVALILSFLCGRQKLKWATVNATESARFSAFCEKHGDRRVNRLLKWRSDKLNRSAWEVEILLCSGVPHTGKVLMLMHLPVA
jgi:hypothetical protein